MKISATYRFIAAFLSISILAGVSLPAGLHAKAQEECNLMENMHADHTMPEPMMNGHDDCPMAEKHSTDHSAPSVAEAGMHDFGLVCACSVEEAPVQPETTFLKKIKVPVFPGLTLFTLSAIPEAGALSRTGKSSQTDLYSPPPIFLFNAAFLN